MHTLPLPFTLLTYFGIWRPVDWTSKWKNKLYNLLSIAVLLTMCTFVASEFVHVALFFSKFDEISDTLFLLMTTLAACYKPLTFLLQRKNIIHLANMLLEECCIAKNPTEMNIQQKFDDINRFQYRLFIFLA